MDPDTPKSTSSRKVKFAPKPPPRRAKKQVVTKTESSRQDASDDEAVDDNLRRRVNEHLNRGKSKVEKKAVQVAFSLGVASSAPLRTYGNPRDGTSDSKGLKSSAYGDQQDLVPFPSDTAVSDEEEDEYQEPWDYKNSYYPITLPLRKPPPGDPEILDEAEFGEAARNVEYDEKKINDASELGLQDKDKTDERKYIFVQIPDNLPFQRQTKSCAAPPKKGCKLEELPGGYMGKMLVYKSGAVKLKVENILYEVFPGSGINLTHDVVAINPVDKNFCMLRKPKEEAKHAVVALDVDSLLG